MFFVGSFFNNGVLFFDVKKLKLEGLFVLYSCKILFNGVLLFMRLLLVEYYVFFLVSFFFKLCVDSELDYGEEWVLFFLLVFLYGSGLFLYRGCDLFVVCRRNSLSLMDFGIEEVKDGELMFLLYCDNKVFYVWYFVWLILGRCVKDRWNVYKSC